MSPSRRPPRPPQPSGRPRVAGLRRPSPRPRPEHARPADPAGPEETTESTGTGGVSGIGGTTDALEAREAQGAAEPAEPAEPAEEAGAPETAGTGGPEGAAETREPDDAAQATQATQTPESDEVSGLPPAAAAERPAPRRKVRDNGRPKPDSEDDVPPHEPEPVGGGDGAGPEAGTRHSRRGYGRVAALLAVGVLLAGLAVFFQIQHSEVRAQTENTALIDVAGTSEVKEAMSSAAESLFSIDYNDLGKTERAAADLLVNDEVKQKYDALMGEVKRLAPEQKIVVTVQATRSAVVTLDDDRAKVMVFIDQTATRASDNRSSAGGAALWFTTERRDGAWKVTDMDTYASAQPTPTPSPEPSGQAPAPQNGG